MSIVRVDPLMFWCVSADMSSLHFAIGVCVGCVRFLSIAFELEMICHVVEYCSCEHVNTGRHKRLLHPTMHSSREQFSLARLIHVFEDKQGGCSES